jgi:phosphoribosylformylglycinamidine synthase PurS subunit
MKTRIVVTLKPNVLDPQGKAIEGALRSLGLDGFASVRQGKVFDIELQGVDGEAADRLVRAACEKLLANTIVENFAIQNG